MNCDGVRELLSAYVDGELAPGELLRVEQHLRRCQSCAGEVDALRQTIALVSSLEEVEPPADFHAKLHARLVEQGPPASRRTPMARPWRRRVQWASAAAAAAVLGLSLASYQLSSHGAAGLEASGQAAIAPQNPPQQVVDNTTPKEATPPAVTQPGSKPQGGNGGSQSAPSNTGSGVKPSNPTQSTQITPPGPTDTTTTGPKVAGLLDDVRKPDPTVQMTTTTYSLTAEAANPSAVLAEIQKLVPGAADPQGSVLTLSVPATGADSLIAAIKEKLGATVTEAPPVPTDLSYQYDLQYKALESYATQFDQLQKQRKAATTPDAIAKADEALAALKEQFDRAKADLNRTVAQSQKVQIIVTVKSAP